MLTVLSCALTVKAKIAKSDIKIILFISLGLRGRAEALPVNYYAVPPSIAVLAAVKVPVTNANLCGVATFTPATRAKA